MLIEGKYGAADDDAADKSNVFCNAKTGATTLLHNKNRCDTTQMLEQLCLDR